MVFYIFQSLISLWFMEFSLVVLDLKQENELVLRSCVWRGHQRRSRGNRTGLSSLYGHRDGGKETETTTTFMEEAKNRNGDIEQERGTRREQTSALLLVVRATGKQMKCTAPLTLTHLMKNKNKNVLRTHLIEKLFTVKSCRKNTLHSFCPAMLWCFFFVLYQRQRKVIGAIAASRDQG